MTKPLIAVALAASVVGANATGAQAQSFPTHFVTIVVPLATGGSTDIIARIMAEGMRGK